MIMYRGISFKRVSFSRHSYTYTYETTTAQTAAVLGTHTRAKESLKSDSRVVRYTVFLLFQYTTILQ